MLTDENFCIIEEFEIRSRRMPHIVPRPCALLVTSVSPLALDQAEFSYYEFSTRIRNKLLSWSPAVVFGYNTLNFDERYLHSLFYQNLYPPYLTQTNGNSRPNILPLVRAAEQVHPSLLNYPINKDGETSRKLEDISAANGFADHQAHDALGDVMATVQLSKIIKESSPTLWNSATSATSRSAFNGRLDQNNQLVFYDQNGCWPVIYPSLKIGKVDGGRNTLFFDLRHDPKTTNLEKPKKCFTGRDRSFRVCKDAEVHITFSLEEWYELDAGPNFSDHVSRENVSQALAVLDISATIDAFHSAKKSYDKSPHVEEQIYDYFHAFDEERWLINDFHNADPDLKKVLADRFKDPRFSTFARRLIFENFSNQMPSEQITEYETKIFDRIHTMDEVPWMTVSKAVTEFDMLEETMPDRANEIDLIRRYVLSL